MLTQLRLHHQGISAPLSPRVVDTVRHLLAMQAQDYYGALWAVGLRSESVTEAQVEQAIADREIVRTWPMRGTLHFVAADDVRWMLKLTASRAVSRDIKRQERDFGLDAKTVAHYADAVFRILEGGKRLTRSALYEALQARRIATDGQRGLHILGRLAHEGFICQGPREGKQPTFVLLDEWLPPTPARERDVALAELAQRYFTRHGPATVQDLAWWSGLTVRDARIGLELAKHLLASMLHDGTHYWFAGDPAPSPGGAAAVHLLPPFDEYLVGYKDRSAMLASDHTRRVIGINGLINPGVVVNGRIAATWKRTLQKDRATLSLAPLRPLGKTELAAIHRAARRYGDFLGRPAALAEIG